MGAFEVTQEQWQKVMGKNPANFKGEGNFTCGECDLGRVYRVLSKVRKIGRFGAWDY